MDELDEFNEAPHIVRERERGSDDYSHPSLDTVSVNAGIPSNLNGDICTDLLDGDDLDTELLTDLNKNSHIIA